MGPALLILGVLCIWLAIQLAFFAWLILREDPVYWFPVGLVVMLFAGAWLLGWVDDA